MKAKYNKTLKICMDTALNIYLPDFHLYLVNNYEPLPNFVLYHILNNTNITNNTNIFNNICHNIV